MTQNVVKLKKSPSVATKCVARVEVSSVACLIPSIASIIA